MKKILKKNQVIVTSLAVLVAAAGYLNFAEVDLGGGETQASTDSGSILDEVDTIDYDLTDQSALLAENGTQAASLDDTSALNDGTPGEAILTGASNFAVEARLSREQTRSQNKADLQAIIDNQELSQDQKQEAVSAMVTMTETAEKEAAAELLLEAKGFENVIVNLTGETADIVVPDMELENDAVRAQIEDIVKRKTGASPEQIIITPLSAGSDEASLAGEEGQEQTQETALEGEDDMQETWAEDTVADYDYTMEEAAEDY
ncbi:MAG: SpoIIIAH-like family protein [Eubacteriales bacterium]|nr:SpoIIIAH-like family protein [Eubacteriales bacterium]